MNNEEVFDVIVKAIMEKVRIGTDDPNQLNLSEVIAYVQNIPVEIRDSELLHNLVSLRDIHGEEKLLKDIKINMSLREILDRGEEVIFKMTEYQV